jgi:hypothetical protein
MALALDVFSRRVEAIPMNRSVPITRSLAE